MRHAPRGALCLALALLLGAATFGGHATAEERVDPAVIASYRRALKEYDYKATERFFHLAREKPSREVIALVMEGMLAFSDWSTVYETGMETMTSFGFAALDPLFQELMSDPKRSPLILAVILDVARSYGGARADEWVVLGLQHPEELVIRNAIDAAEYRGTKDAVPLLIDLLEKRGMNGGMLSFDARRALLRMTGNDLATVGDWRAFWDSNKDSLKPAAADPKSPNLAMPKLEADGSLPTFFGVEIVSRRIVFVIDTTATMAMLHHGEQDAADLSSADKQRITRVKRELAKVIDKLPEDAEFNIVSVNNKDSFFSKELTRASAPTKKKALRFVESLSPTGDNRWMSFGRMLEDHSVDMILLVSDGMGELKTKDGAAGSSTYDRMAKDLGEENRLTNVRIYTFGFESLGEWPAGSKLAKIPPEDPGPVAKFLETLAREHSGIHTTIP